MRDDRSSNYRVSLNGQFYGTTMSLVAGYADARELAKRNASAGVAGRSEVHAQVDGGVRLDVAFAWSGGKITKVWVR